MIVRLHGFGLTIDALAAIVAGAGVSIADDARARMASSRAIVDRAVKDRLPVYGVTTGLGPKAVEALPEDQLQAFAIRTVRGRAHAAGADLPPEVCRAALAVRLNTLLIGAAGARPELADMMAACIAAGLAPAMRSAGSIGAADLMHGGDFGLALIGEGRMWSAGAVVPAADALAAAGIAPHAPGPREGLALVSHSSVAAAAAALAVAQAETWFNRLQEAAALTMEGFRANPSPLDPDLLALRPQPGQDEAAAGLRALLEHSALNAADAPRRLQDPLSIRNLPQVHGAFLAALSHARDAAEAEINGASDNPGVLVARGEVRSHGGFLSPHLSLATTGLAQALSLALAVAVQRIAKLTSARFSGLEPGLTPLGAAGAGLGPIMKTAEALWAEIAHLSTPPPIYPSASADGLEDVALPTVRAAMATLEALSQARRLTAIEMIVAAEAVERRALGDDLAPRLRQALRRVRAFVAPLGDDRAFGDEIEALAVELATSASF